MGMTSEVGIEDGLGRPDDKHIELLIVRGATSTLHQHGCDTFVGAQCFDVRRQHVVGRGNMRKSYGKVYEQKARAAVF